MKRYKMNVPALCIYLIGLCLSVNVSFAAQTTEESEALIEKLVAQINSTVVAISEVERKAGNDLKDIHIVLDIPAKQSPNIGLVLDIDDNNGYRVLSVSPGGLADSVNIAKGDIITAINDVDTVQVDGPSAFAILEQLTPGERVKIVFNRDGKYSTVQTQIIGQYSPPIKIELGVAKEDVFASQLDNEIPQNDELDHDNAACGRVSVFFKPPRSQQLHNVFINQIDDNNVNRRDASFKLAPGKHTIFLHELIDDPFFTRRSRTIQKAKPLDIEVKANTTYYLAAKFIKEKRNKERKGEYWEPVVWKVLENRTCDQ
jgi:hypothetical protein